MDILTQKETTEFIKKLQAFDSKRGVKKANLNILEPRFFDLIITKLGTQKVLELERVSNSCEQICEEYGIEYKGCYSRTYGSASVKKLPKEWNGDIVVGLANPKTAKEVVKEGLNLLQDGHWLAIYQPYSFLEGTNRYLGLFKDQPFSKIFVTPARPLISPDGDFDIVPSKNGAWFVWFKGQPVKNPEIEWIPDELFEKYFVFENGKMLKPGLFGRVYKRPIKVIVDQGRSKHATQI